MTRSRSSSKRLLAVLLGCIFIITSVTWYAFASSEGSGEFIFDAIEGIQQINDDQRDRNVQRERIPEMEDEKRLAGNSVSECGREGEIPLDQLPAKCVSKLTPVSELPERIPSPPVDRTRQFERDAERYMQMPLFAAAVEGEITDIIPVLLEDVLQPQFGKQCVVHTKYRMRVGRSYNENLVGDFEFVLEGGRYETTDMKLAEECVLGMHTSQSPRLHEGDKILAFLGKDELTHTGEKYYFILGHSKGPQVLLSSPLEPLWEKQGEVCYGEGFAAQAQEALAKKAQGFRNALSATSVFE